MAWSSSRRKERFDPSWPRTRQMILERDGWRCQWPVKDEFGVESKCLAPSNEVDHKERAENGMPDDDSPENLWALCHWHHSYKTELESADARAKYRERRKEKRWYSHPAFL
ncbi:HNH endonuclease [Bifidobacterium eulemuris]|uniref:HNH endonuclease n=1 Tax=Bifidobacterium eulemuris TaxID=1765219 RepID=A0A261GAQ8_9BIFI|nr:HNH endonuclease [Bifidobacterium eulemuris]OZG68265.1 HNH endonuclease [Bifidobacterium eulemuris]QOL31679.1 HNH endonuclease [Bifidobacterium eulemuris]